LPAFDLHELKGFRHGPWWLTFDDGDACRVDYEQYH
jgi:hypothetical protein